MKINNQSIRYTILILLISFNLSILNGQNKCFDLETFDTHTRPNKYLDEDVVLKCLDKIKYKSIFRKVKDWTPVIQAYRTLKSKRANKFKAKLVKEIDHKISSAINKKDEVLALETKLNDAEEKMQELGSEIKSKDKKLNAKSKTLEKEKAKLQKLIDSEEDGEEPNQSHITKEKKEVEKLEKAHKNDEISLNKIKKQHATAKKEVRSLSKKIDKLDQKSLLDEISKLEELKTKVNNL